MQIVFIREFVISNINKLYQKKIWAEGGRCVYREENGNNDKKALNILLTKGEK